MKEVLLSLLGGGVIGGATVAIIEGVKEALAWRRNRKAQKEDRAEEKADKKIEERIEKLEEGQTGMQISIQTMVECQRYILYDRIRYLSLKYLAEGEIDIDDKTNLHNLHTAYEKTGGNGDFKQMLPAVDKLPLKQKSRT